MGLGLLTAAVGLTFASAPPVRAELHFSRANTAAACSEQTLRDGVASRMGYSPFTEGAPVKVWVDISGAEPLSARLRIDRPSASAAARALQGPGDCRGLTDALAFAIALALDPLAMSRPAAPEPPAPAPAAPPPATPEPTSSLPSVPPPGPTRHLELQASTGFETGTQPAGFLQAQGGASWRGDILGAEAGPSFVLPSRFELPGGGAVDTFSVGLQAALCAGRRTWGACAAVRGGVLQFDASGLGDNRHGSAPSVSVGPRAYWQFPSEGTYALRVGAELWVPLLRALMYVDGQRVWTQPSIAGALQVGVVLRVF